METKTTREQFKKAIESFLEEEETTLEDVTGDIDDMNRLFYWVLNECEDVESNFDIAKREDDNESWLQCDYYSKKLQYTVILHNDFEYSQDTIEDIINDLMAMQARVIEVESRIK